MSVTLHQPVRIAGNAWSITWTGDGPAFYVYYRGQLVGITQQTEYRLTAAAGTFPFVEVTDDATVQPAQLGAPGRVKLVWYSPGGQTVQHYRVEQYVGSAWTLRARVYENATVYHEWESDWLLDQTTARYRVIPVDGVGNQGAATEFLALVVHHPESPAVVVSAYNPSTQVATIGAT